MSLQRQLQRRVGDVIGPRETRSQLIARGFSSPEADEIMAVKTFLNRAGDPDLEPTRADHDYQRGALSGLGYLQAVAPEVIDA